jgi:hypothetical protein
VGHPKAFEGIVVVLEREGNENNDFVNLYVLQFGERLVAVDGIIKKL